MSGSFCFAVGIPELLSIPRGPVSPSNALLVDWMFKDQQLGGWKSVKSFQRYIRLAGVDIQGATEGLDLLPPLIETRCVMLKSKN